MLFTHPDDIVSVVLGNVCVEFYLVKKHFFALRRGTFEIEPIDPAYNKTTNNKQQQQQQQQQHWINDCLLGDRRGSMNGWIDRSDVPVFSLLVGE